MLLVRHAESVWNSQFGPHRIDAGLPDPPITLIGATQARELIERLRDERIDRILASPYRRALQTATIIAEALGRAILVEPLVRERCAFSCDQGRPRSELERLWPHLDFGGLEERWWGGTIESHASLQLRAENFRERASRLGLVDRSLVVSHWGFIRAMTGVALGNVGVVRAAGF